MAEVATILQAFRFQASERPEEIAFRTRRDEVALTWGQTRERVDALAGALAGLGLGRGDTVALMLANRPEFHVCDLAVLTTGATPFSIYQTNPPNEIEYIAGHAGARIFLTEQQFLPQVLAARRNLPGVEHVIVIDGEAPDGVMHISDLEAGNGSFNAEASAAAVQPDDLLTLIYTSGTTGPPKGVEITHRNFFAYSAGMLDMNPALRPGAEVISWLPNAHIAERCAHHYLPILCGLRVTCCADGREILDYLPEVRPAWFFSVPRIWEKLQTKAEHLLAQQLGSDPSMLRDAVSKVRHEQRGEMVPQPLAARVAEADERYFAPLRRELGLDRGSAHVGGAPAQPELLEFFNAIGVRLGELWGMSETTGAGTMNPPDRLRIGTVGKPMLNVEIRLAEDGEMLVRGGIVTAGYHNQPQATAEAFTEDGWLRTGDIGEVDGEGYFKIVDRKKELIINAAGKNMSPANIESALKAASPLIAQACAIGDRRPFNTALIVLDIDYAPRWAAENGLGHLSLELLAGYTQVRDAVQEGVDRANARLSRVEQIKLFTIIRGDWAPAGDELTPTMKLKRKAIAAKYGESIDAMYGAGRQG